MQIVIAFSCLIRINRDYDRLEQVKSMANIFERISWIIKSAIFLASKIPYIQMEVELTSQILYSSTKFH